MYKALIVDDEEKLREVLNIKLNQFCPEIQVMDQASNAEEAFTKINLIRPQLIFLDISMPIESGFDLINKFDTIDFEIIFVTGFNEFALDALKVSAVDYILKPVQTASLIKAVNKAKSRIDERSKIEKYELLKHNLHHLGDQNTKIAIPGSQAYEFVKIEHIIRCEGWQKYTKIFLTEGNVIVSSYNIGVFREMLENYDFFSTHKSHLINKNHITRYLKDGTVVMSDGSSAPVSRRKKEEFMEQVVKYLAAF
ncbi:MAG: LytTR family DNA-binding domain-containing protein [Saprospiraceae bacterium]|nr:LytTR family DNA-binding domain-containing protein [Saprospiraceae bacterium]